MDEVNKLREQFARMIDDGRKVEAFTSIGEWQWYVDAVVKPTIADYTDRIMSGKIASDKEDWVLRGMVLGLRLLIDTTETFKAQAETARNDARKLEDGLKNQ